MADRFPSIDDFDVGAQTEPKDCSTEPSADDFLAREKAILGDDASQFVTGDDAVIAESTGELPGQSVVGDSTFESQFPDLISPSLGTGGLSIDHSITRPSVSYSSGYQIQENTEPESEVIQKWREQRNSHISKLAQQFAQQREDTIKQAQQNIDDFYENYNTKKEKGIAQTRKEAEQFLDTRDDGSAGGTSWERIARLVDVSGKGPNGGATGSGKERFREILTSLRKDEKAPGATA